MGSRSLAVSVTVPLAHPRRRAIVFSSSYAPLFDRFGSLTFLRGTFLYGMSDRMCSIVFRRAVLLVVGSHEVPRRDSRVGLRQHLIARARVVVPAGARRQIHRAELPLPHRVVDARLEAPLLLVVADLEPELDQMTPPSTRNFSICGQSSRNRSCSFFEQKPMTGSTPARLYQLRSKITTSPAAGKCCRYRCM